MLNELGGGVPHQIIEYSDNLERVLDISGLVEALHGCAEAQDELPVAGLRTRAYATAEYLIADRHPDNGFIAVYLRVGQGREVETLQRIGTTLADTLADYVRRTAGEHPIALSYEVQEIDTALRWNHNNLREHMAERQSARA